MSVLRLEHDSSATSECRRTACGARRRSARRHFRISGERMPRELILALALVKRACATVNAELGTLDAGKAAAIAAAADEVLAGKWEGEFPLVGVADRLGHADQHEPERGAGEPRLELMGGERGEARLVHPNDDVNRGQSSNDVFPTAMHVAAVRRVSGALVPALRGCALRSRKNRRHSPTSSRSAAPTCRTPRR